MMFKLSFDILFQLFGVIVIGIFGWAFQRSFALGNRVTILETRYDDLKDLINTRFDDTNGRLDWIQAKITAHGVR